MEKNKTTTLHKMADISFYFTVVIGISFSVYLFRQLVTKKIFRKKYVLQHFLLIKSLSDILVWLSALASFATERYMERLSFYPLSLIVWHGVFCNILIGMSCASLLILIVYCCLKLWYLIGQKEHEEVTVSIFLTSTLLVAVALINILMVRTVHIFSSTRQFVPLPLLFSATIGLDIVTILVFLVAFVVLVALSFKKLLKGFINKNKGHTNTITISAQQDDVTTILITDDNGKIAVNGEGIGDEPKSKSYTNAELTPHTANTKLVLFLVGVSFVSFLLNCIFLFQKTIVFFSDEAIIYSYFSTFSLIIVIKIK